MFMQKLIKLFVAIAIALPAIVSWHGNASAERFLSRQHIVDGLQKKKRSHRVKRRGQRRVKGRNSKRQARKRAPQGIRAPSSRRRSRAPAKQKFRAPPQRVVRRRAPPSNGGAKFSRPPQGENPTLRNRAPTPEQRVVRRRAPRSESGQQRLRAPGRAPDPVANQRVPNRNPERFDTEVASTSDEINQRGIRIDERVATNPDAASVDLEILFDYDSAKISPKSVRQLMTLGEALMDPSLAGSRIMIAGHTDAAGGNNYNANLSFRRAQSVSDFLINYAGIPSNRLAIEGFGEELLKYPDAPNSGQNRRVEIINLGS